MTVNSDDVGARAHSPGWAMATSLRLSENPAAQSRFQTLQARYAFNPTDVSYNWVGFGIQFCETLQMFRDQGYAIKDVLPASSAQADIATGETLYTEILNRFDNKEAIRGHWQNVVDMASYIMEGGAEFKEWYDAGQPAGSNRMALPSDFTMQTPDTATPDTAQAAPRFTHP